MSQAELMALPQPAMANILRYMVGEWGCSLYQYRSDHFHHWLLAVMDDVTSRNNLIDVPRWDAAKKLGQGQSKTSTKLFIVYHCCIDERVLVNVPCDRLRVSICLFDVYRSDFDLLLARGDLSNDLFLSAKRQ